MREVEDIAQLIDDCRKTLADILDSPNLWFRVDEPWPRVKRYTFGNDKASRAEVGNRVYSPMPLCRVGNKRYWVAPSLELQLPRGGFYLKDVSMVIFEGDVADQIKTAVLRAEWNSEQQSGEIVHAQPHWHAYLTAVSPAFGKSTPAGMEGQTQTFSFPKDTSAQKSFHFAMASRWHVGGRNAHATDLESDALARWLDGCLNYIREQLGYVS